MPNSLYAPGMREAMADDHAFLKALYRSSRSDLAMLAENPVLEPLLDMQQRVQEQGVQREFPDARHWLMLDQEEPAARLILDTNHQRLHVIDIAVLSPWRNKGLGTRLLRWAQNQAAEAHLPLELRVQHSNTSALRLYKRLGFRVVDSDELSQRMRWLADT
ncbi:GNAT family N-acetyltransferase [Pseudomonas sp. 21LCFQ02]|uniref:GNAT family N-acetyltransferase n=1 Tax=unclassified Pseudomonas TaxID=196821 RepID=UPI00209A963B|nr:MULTISPECIES: GNAT family N-acetyltransferase [unclassified Pseudomonas]MCO8169971.1 GNAT family N-acetyltransferase [Pseudomonas sp. 21LCFQ02]MCQ9426498.1 GNAT family N-acetyltransferase [Pseudomonas sp. LJDD11]